MQNIFVTNCVVIKTLKDNSMLKKKVLRLGALWLQNNQIFNFN